MKPISSKLLIKIPIKDNGEKLINLKDFYPEIATNIDTQSIKRQKIPKDTCYVRESVAKKLCKAQKALPKNCRLRVKGGYRSLKEQKRIYHNYFNELKKKA